MNTQPLNTVSRAFRGLNFITPHVIGYESGHYAGRTMHIEISRENPPYWDTGPMYGVTIKRPNGKSLDPDPSRCCESLEEVREYLDSL